MGTRGPSRARRPARRTVTPESVDVCRVRPSGRFTDAAREAAQGLSRLCSPSNISDRERGHGHRGRGGLPSGVPPPPARPSAQPDASPGAPAASPLPRRDGSAAERDTGRSPGSWKCQHCPTPVVPTGRQVRSSLGRAVRAAARSPRAEVPLEPVGSLGEPTLPAGIFSTARAALRRARLLRAACLLHLLT